MSSWLRDSRAHLALAWPLCLGQVGQQIMALVDSVMVGHYDRVALAGFGVANTLLFAVSCVGVGMLLGLDSLVPQALGRGDPREARSLYHSGVRLAIRVGIPLTILAALSPVLMDLFGVQADVQGEAAVYLYGRLPSLIPHLIFIASSSYLQAVGVTRPLVLAVVIGNLVNLVADALLVFGDQALSWLGLPALGLPALGALGASLSTCVVSIVMMATLLYALSKHRVPRGAEASAQGVARIRKLGTPIALQQVAEVGIFTIVTLLAGRLGVIPASAHQIALTLATITFSFSLGMGAATSVRVGYAVGRGQHQEARRAGMVGLSWGAGLMAIAGLFFAFTPDPLARLFTSDAEILEATPPLLLVAALFQFSDATQAVLAGALRGAGDTRATLIGNLLGHYGVGLWVALGMGFGLGMGATGLWWGLSAGLSVTALGLAARFWWLTGRPIQQA